MISNQRETCEFIAGHTAELARLATGANLRDLAYLLGMAQIEADNQVIARRKPKKAA
jgi:hypothetical protein